MYVLSLSVASVRYGMVRLFSNVVLLILLSVWSSLEFKLEIANLFKEKHFFSFHSVVGLSVSFDMFFLVCFKRFIFNYKYVPSNVFRFNKLSSKHNQTNENTIFNIICVCYMKSKYGERNVNKIVILL